MNARAQLVDSWRQIAVQANSLLGTLTVDYHVDSFTPANQAKPFEFAGKTSTQRLGVNWDLPLVRRLERNNYRVSLINYQRQRRSLMSTEDSILNNLRNELRQLRVLAETYQIQVELIALAYAQVENALDTFAQPPAPGATTGDAAQAAALTNQVLQAQNGLNNAQSRLYSTWINYLTNRMQLYRDLELMPLDIRGVWLDEDAVPKPVRRTQPGNVRPAGFIADKERLSESGTAPLFRATPAAGDLQWRATQAPQKTTRP